jgi:hypothetical protein
MTLKLIWILIISNLMESIILKIDVNRLSDHACLMGKKSNEHM